jgi:hypothetical protein
MILVRSLPPALAQLLLFPGRQLERLQRRLVLLARCGDRDRVLDVDGDRRVSSVDVEGLHPEGKVGIGLVGEQGSVPPLGFGGSISLSWNQYRYHVVTSRCMRPTLMFFSAVSNSESRPAFLAFSAIRFLSSSS